MNKELKRFFYDELQTDKIRINWNKQPIPMKMFLEFLTVEVERSHDHAGSTTGWTRLTNKDLKLTIGGGIVGNTEYLDTLQFGTNLSNPYNNYVSPFYLFDILTKAGQEFFLEYYKAEIDLIVKKKQNIIQQKEKELAFAKQVLADIELEIEELKIKSLA